MVHVVGANDPSLDAALTAHQNSYKAVIEGPLYVQAYSALTVQHRS
jgi:hypothetical protein